MPDPFSGASGTTAQEKEILNRSAERKLNARTFSNGEKQDGGADKKDKKERKKKAPARVSQLYNTGIELLASFGLVARLDEAGDHCKHRILKAQEPPMVKGIQYPKDFNPLRDISTEAHFELLEMAFASAACTDEVRDFWDPLVHPKAGDNPLLSFAEQRLHMQRISDAQNIHQVLDYGHSFDPIGRLGGSPALTPTTWVPDKDWFSPKLRELKFSDVFTIFPDAEQEMLRLIIGRIGVGRSNHKPPGWEKPIDHTARMAGVIVGKDAGLGKSTLFNGMTAAFQRCGFVTHTFKNTEDRFGMKTAALSDIAYKDDTSLTSLRKFLMAEETKIMISNGLFSVEDKFIKGEQVWPKCVILVNSNDWNSKFAYDLDPGIIDRIKIISTYREYEVSKNRDHLEGTISDGTPDLRPRAHIPYLAEKLEVEPAAIYLWCLRLATDNFWEVISDVADPSINRLQVEVRYWTTRQRIRFKADVMQGIINSMAFAHAVRKGAPNEFMPELTPNVLYEFMESWYFVGIDPSCQGLTVAMKKEWETAGRPSTHYYQGFREVRWESVKKSIAAAKALLFDEAGNSMGEARGQTSLTIMKGMIEGLVLRDGFKMGGEASYAIENWENCRHAQEELVLDGRRLIAHLDEEDLARLTNQKAPCYDDWILDKHYSPDKAEVMRVAARKRLYSQKGVKVS